MSWVCAQALKAVQSMNGVELGGRPMMVREDREDRDVKNYQNESGREQEGEAKGCQVKSATLYCLGRNSTFGGFFFEKF